MSNCRLALEDGSVFQGWAIGATGTATGEVVFNTAMTGYQEILTDPSYCGQIVCMTWPMIGNYGVNEWDVESSAVHLSGFVVKELSRVYSNHRAQGDLSSFLSGAGIIGISGIDTRALTRRLRVHGAMRGVLSTEIQEPRELVELASDSPKMTGQNLVQKVARAGQTGEETKDDNATHHVVVVDCGVKQNILRMLQTIGCHVTVLPPDVPPQEIIGRKPDGVLIGNGPGDPAAVSATIDTLRQLVGKVPMFGICLGHQLLGLALGAKTYKLKFGHHGSNHPVLDVDTGRVEITAQNHGFAVDEKSLSTAGAQITHINLNDQSVEGFKHEDHRVFAVQFHPEAAPGPTDSTYLFQRFRDLMLQS